VSAAIVVAQHVGPLSFLPSILQSQTTLPVVTAATGDALTRGYIYVCPPGHHIVINPDATLSVSSRQHVKCVRPRGDWLFASAAASFGDRAIGVVLSGMLKDGAAGVRRLHAAGAQVAVQDPVTCLVPDMPRAALATGCVDAAHPPQNLASWVGRILEEAPIASSWRQWVEPFDSPPLD
jgi:two-component system chemotaxis response regulator CheB